MKKLFTLTFILFSFFAKADYWTQKADFTGPARSGAFSFSINSKGYMGSGQDTTNNNYLHDFWEFDPAANVWTQKANFGGNPRILGIGFSIAGKGYAGLGGITLVSTFNDLWEYDPATNIWTQKANFGGINRTYASCFAMGNMGYAGIGTDMGWGTYYNDFWQYDPVIDTWTAKANFPGIARADAVGFAIGNKGYFGTGYTTSGALKDFWQYDPAINSWTQIADFPFNRYDASAFVICNKAFVGTGNNGPFYADIWQYDTTANQWTQKTNFSGITRDLAVCFSINNKGYLGIGWKDAGPFYRDLWEYTPDSINCTTGIEELPTSNLDFTISPNPAKEYLIISYPLAGKKNIYITITDAQGKKVYETIIKPLTSDLRLPTSDFSKGIYFAEVSNGKQKAVKKFIKE
jgi:N-acetylneuraminic acid mutarotase